MCLTTIFQDGIRFANHPKIQFHAPNIPICIYPFTYISDNKKWIVPYLAEWAIWPNVSFARIFLRMANLLRLSILRNNSFGQMTIGNCCYQKCHASFHKKMRIQNITDKNWASKWVTSHSLNISIDAVLYLLIRPNFTYVI